MDRFLVYEEQVEGPATHAIVLGVGRYPYLNGGDGGRLFQDHQGLGQLTSPPASAHETAKWLTNEFHHPDRPLATVSLLVSDAAPAKFRRAEGESEVAVEPANFQNVNDAVLAWKARGDSAEENMMLFFFCGHGVAGGAELALLLEDYGARDDAGMNTALDFRRFRLGMERCKARTQCYFVDACRTPDVTLERAGGFAGQPILTPTTRQTVRLKPVFYSTLEGSRAYSARGRPSRFTSALLQAFRGAGADDSEGSWRVDTNQLQKSVQFLMKRAEKEGFQQDQINPADDLSTVELHHLRGEPEVPVVLGCSPDYMTAEAELSYASATRSDRRDPRPEEWDLVLPTDDYEFAAKFTATGDDVRTRRAVRPPYRKVSLEVQP